MIQVHEQSSLRKDPDGKHPTKTGKQSSEKTLIRGGNCTWCHINLNNHSRRSLWQPLIDRVANGGISGNNSSKIAGAGTYIDLCGVDDHTISNLELVTAGATVESQVGPIIIIVYQYARMTDGKTIHSSGQIEHFKALVNEKSISVTSEVPCIELIEGYRTPLSTINDLACMKMRPFTKEEWDTLPHVHIASEAPWDPKVLDHVPPIKRYKEQPQSLKLIEESLFDQHGECKESSSPVSEKEDKVLDAKTPTDDPNYGNTTIETSKSNMRAHLHNLVWDEIVPEHRIFFTGRQILEVDIDCREEQPTRCNPRGPSTKNRRSPRDHPPTCRASR